MPDSSWKEPYRQALEESDAHKLTTLVQAAEYAIVLRLQELENSTDHHEERIEMKLATADLLVIKTYKLGWPGVP
jgi:4-diphosphocytidyl-2C-methyl-D-erythritol kinase